jgi:hypothetical protein
MEQKSNGALIGSVVIVVILIIGGIYLWKTAVKEKTTSDSAANVEANLNSMDMDGLDNGI